ncbi:helix-turn-helix domain-containing protein [Streptomyces avermitilis]|uniref:helix-turn-helix domain-containing protein n=1 Tax=Streptomyces avermitilis TaxID=33903 RepID=UPI0033D4D71E
MKQSPDTPLPSPEERRRLREAQSLTQAQLAAKLGVSRETVRSWETGRTTPRGRKREAYARALNALTAPQPPAPDPAGPKPGAPKPAAPETAAPKPAAPETEPPAVKPPAEASLRQEQPVRVPVGAALIPLSTADEGPADGEDPAATPVLTPSQAFDALYAFCAPALVRQTYLLTGRRELAREAVERAFQLAWQRWPEVAVDRDPGGWVRATAYEYALSPWHRLRPRHRHPEPPPADAADRVLLDAFLKLPPAHRRTLLLYDGVGLGLPETAAETEASTPAAANRLLHARKAIAARLPELAAPEELHRRLTALASGERLRAARPPTVRTGSEQRARQWTRAAVAFTVVIISATALTLRDAQDHYEPPVAPGATVQGVPPKVAPGPLSRQELELRAKLKAELLNGPERLMPDDH